MNWKEENGGIGRRLTYFRRVATTERAKWMVFGPLNNDGGLALLIPAAYAIDSRGIGIFDIDL